MFSKEKLYFKDPKQGYIYYNMKLHLNERYKMGGKRLKHDYHMHKKLQTTSKLNITINLIFILVKELE